jgi:hypothetical protein
MKTSEKEILLNYSEDDVEYDEDVNNDLHTSNIEELMVPRDYAFDEIKHRIKNILLGEDESGELVIKRTGSNLESREIFVQLEQIKDPKFGIQLARGVIVDFMQKFYTENVLILGVNRKKVFAFGYKQNKKQIPTEYFLIDSITLDMKESCQYMARSKRDNGVVFCSDEEIFSIIYDPDSKKLVKTIHLNLEKVCSILDKRNGTEKIENNYTHLGDSSLCFGEAKIFPAESKDSKTEILFTVYSDYNINKNRELEHIDSSMIFLAVFEDEPNVEAKWEISFYLQTLGRVTNLTLIKNVNGRGKIYYIRGKYILENYLKSFLNQRNKNKSFRINEFDYEKMIYEDSTEIEQFEFSKNGKHILALMDGKVKKIFKYNKKQIPVYFEQDNPVADFAVSGEFLYTGDLFSTLKIWNPQKNRIINDLNLKVPDDILSQFMTLDGMEGHQEIFPENDDQDINDAIIVDIIVNDDFSELIVIMSDKIIFWQIPFMEATKKVGNDLSQSSSICFMEDGTTFTLNCGNILIEKYRNNSLKLLHSFDLPNYCYHVRLISNGDIYVACKEREKKEGEKELNKEEIMLLNAPTKVIRYIGPFHEESEEIFTTNKVLTSLDVVYKRYLTGQYGAMNLPELAVLVVVNQSDLINITRSEEGVYTKKLIPKMSIDDPELMKSLRENRVNNIQESSDLPIKDNNMYATEMTQMNNPVESEIYTTKGELTSSSNNNDKFRFEHFEYFRELNYFIGYMTTQVSPNEREIHFIAFNPFRTQQPKIIKPKILVEKIKENSNPSKYRLFIERIDTGHYMIGFNSNMGSFFVELNKIDGSIIETKTINQKTNPKVSGQMLSESMYLFLPYQNKMEVYDYESTDKVFTLETQKNILEMYKSSDGKFICAFDSVAMYVVDVEKMIIVQKVNLTNREFQTKSMIINMPFFSHFREYRLPELIQDVNVLKILDHSQITGLRYMPVDILAKCFSDKDNRASLISFGEFYSETISKFNNFDYIFGPLNPYIFTIFYSEEQTLQYLLENFEYPKSNLDFYTPLEYSFLRNENDCLRIMCNLLMKKDSGIYYTQDEFKYLLEKEFVFCDSLISKIPMKIPFKKINLTESMEDDHAVRYNSSLKNFLLENEKRQYEMEHNKTEEEKKQSNERFEIKFVPFRYSFSPGTTDSMDFLNYYAESESDIFVKSQWKTIIHDKWASLKSIYAFNAVIFWIYMVFCTWSITFNINTSDEGLIIGEQIIEIRYMALAFNIIIAFLEILQMISYCFYKPSLYFGDFWNYIDFIALIFGFLFFLSLHKQATEGGSVFIALILMLLIYYRGFSYFRYFDSFTSMIGIINTIVAESLSFFGVMFYTYIVILFLLYRVEPSDTFINKMRDAYIFTFFGGVEQDHFEAKYIFFPMFVGTMVVTIILLNVLIAFMSNVYNKMELQQSVISLKEKASMLLDLEVYISLFVKIKDKIKTSRLDEEEKEEFYYNQSKVTFFMSKIEGLVKKDGPNNTYYKIIQIEKGMKQLEKSLQETGNKNDKQFTSLKKKIKSISQFIGFEQNATSHFDAKMQSILRELFEDFSLGITENVLETIEEDFNIVRQIPKRRNNRVSLLNFKSPLPKAEDE